MRKMRGGNGFADLNRSTHEKHLYKIQQAQEDLLDRAEKGDPDANYALGADLGMDAKDKGLQLSYFIKASKENKYAEFLIANIKTFGKQHVEPRKQELLAIINTLTPDQIKDSDTNEGIEYINTL